MKATTASPKPTGAVAAGPGQDLRLTLTDGREVQAVNALLDAGVPVHREDDGSIVVPASARDLATELADRFGVRFTGVRKGPRGPVLEGGPVLAAAVAADELLVLRELGFIEGVTIGHSAGFTWDSRAFLSFPARHDLSRRVDANYLAGLVARHQLDAADARRMMRALAYDLAKETYKLEEAAQAHTDLQSRRTTGKLLLLP